jgi:ABC-type phosphate transport system substrate-binding protein
MRRRTVLGALAACVAHSVPGHAAKVQIHVVAHPGVGLSEVLRADLASIFLRKLVTWKNGVPALPVDQSMRSPARAAFSDEVLGMSEMSVQAFWQKHLAAGGQEPPPVRGSDTDVLAFVASTPGAVGYILAGTMVPATVREMAIKR